MFKLDIRALNPSNGNNNKQESPQTSPRESWIPQASTVCTSQSDSLRKMWNEPDWASFQTRSKTYMKDQVKCTTDAPLFELVWFDLFKGEREELLHLSQSKQSFVQKALTKYGHDVPQLFVVNLLVPGTPTVAAVQYFALKKRVGTNEAVSLWNRFMNGTDEFRRNRLKLIPSIPEGPWIVKKSVGNKPVILGKALHLHFFESTNYLEMCIDVASDRVAKHVTALCRSQSSYFTVNMGFVIEGQCEAELPERLLCCVQYDHIDLQLAVSLQD